MTIEFALNRIKNILTESFTHYRVYDKTWGNLVVEIDNTWIFRFPKSDESRELLKKEIIFLSTFAHTAPLPIPLPIFIEKDCIGYRKIPWNALTPNIFRSLSSWEKDQIAHDIANFVQWLHALTFTDTHIPIFQNPDKERLLRRTHEMTELSPKAKENALCFFQNADFSLCYDKKKVLIHNDLGEGNILIDATSRISGVIDFGRLIYGYPEMDFAKLWRNFGKSFAENVLELCHYNKEQFEYLAICDLLQREKPFFQKIEAIFGEKI